MAARNWHCACGDTTCTVVYERCHRRFDGGTRRVATGNGLRYCLRRHPRRPGYTAIVAGFLISALGGSRTQIGGPTGAFVVIVAGIVAKFGISGLFVVTMLAGIILVVMGATGLGTKRSSSSPDP